MYDCVRAHVCVFMCVVFACTSVYMCNLCLVCEYVWEVVTTCIHSCSWARAYGGLCIFV